MSNFITNEKGTLGLSARLNNLVAHSKELKFLTGFFYFSGFREIYEGLKGRSDFTLKVLVGMEAGSTAFGIIEHDRLKKKANLSQRRDDYIGSLRLALNSDGLDTRQFHEQLGFFAEMVEKGNIIIRKTKDPNHAKLYFFKFDEQLSSIKQSHFITGSSNFTKAGLNTQAEFNVEIGDYGQKEAEDYFDNLWKNAIELTEDPATKTRILEVVRSGNHASQMSPFEAYVKVLKMYLESQSLEPVKADIENMLEKNGYSVYRYQTDAVAQALSMLKRYNGAIIADVVGLGKSVVASMIALASHCRGMVIAPPGLVGDKNGESGWKMYLNQFGLSSWEVRSCGQLDDALEYMNKFGADIDLVIVDEAHRFRNESTDSYDCLNAICEGRKVVLLTATPFNNSPSDILSLLKLFTLPALSEITLDGNLHAQFSKYEKDLNKLSFIRKNYNSSDQAKSEKARNLHKNYFPFEHSYNTATIDDECKRIATAIRTAIEPVTIRRNRLDLKKDPVYKREVLELSDVADPAELFYKLNEEQSKFYDGVLNDFGEGGSFKGALYQPYLYQEDLEVDYDLSKDSNFNFWQQKNLCDFMRRMLVKRFESSFGAFRQSVENFIKLHERVIEFVDGSGGRYVLNRKLLDRTFSKSEDEINEAIEDFVEGLDADDNSKKNVVYNLNGWKTDRKQNFLESINEDLELFKELLVKIDKLELVESDPKAQMLIETIKCSLADNPERKLIVFSEYVDTIRHLEAKLNGDFDGKMFVACEGLGRHKLRKLLHEFDASDANPSDEVKILLASDKFSEGFNLNRAGTIINYDIPWNPTRVIQRVGRINRIGKKVFDKLLIYNCFPSERGADHVRSRQIAENKMMLIHSALGEDCKIFSADEQPSAAVLYSRINANPDEMEEESFFTKMRMEYEELKEKYPEIVARAEKLPSKVKCARSADENRLIMARRKALALFIQLADVSGENVTGRKVLSFEEAHPLIKCEPEEDGLELSERFWPVYKELKKEQYSRPRYGTQSLEQKAMNNLRAALQVFGGHFDKKEKEFFGNLLKCIEVYGCLTQRTLRRLVSISLDNEDKVPDFRDTITDLQTRLTPEFFRGVEERAHSSESEIIVAIEHQAP
jgi:superfamily II DNA or RNA helicase